MSSALGFGDNIAFSAIPATAQYGVINPAKNFYVVLGRDGFTAPGAIVVEESPELTIRMVQSRMGLPANGTMSVQTLDALLRALTSLVPRSATEHRANAQTLLTSVRDSVARRVVDGPVWATMIFFSRDEFQADPSVLFGGRLFFGNPVKTALQGEAITFPRVGELLPVEAVTTSAQSVPKPPTVVAPVPEGTFASRPPAIQTQAPPVLAAKPRETSSKPITDWTWLAYAAIGLAVVGGVVFLVREARTEGSRGDPRLEPDFNREFS